MDDRLAGPRALTFGLLLGLVFWAALFGAICGGSKIASADHKACAHPVLPMPRTYIIRPDVRGGQQLWRAAFNAWNNRHPGVQFVEVPQNYEADVYVVRSIHAPNPAHRYLTRVDMPCNRIESVIYVSDTDDVDLAYWAEHEVGHTLALADHIKAVNNVPGWYQNPKICDNGTSSYDGIMSYCTPRSRWWGWYDWMMLWWWF